MKNFLNLQKNIDIWIYKKDKYWKTFYIRTRTMKRFGSQTFNILIVNRFVCGPRVFNPSPNHCVAYSWQGPESGSVTQLLISLLPLTVKSHL